MSSAGAKARAWVAALITLLCHAERRLPPAVEACFPFRGRWLWYFLVALNALCLLNLGWLFWMFARSLT